jgi:hypothetical protein
VLVAIDDWERLVEVMKELAPLLLLRRASEPLGVILEAFPLDEER